MKGNLQLSNQKIVDLEQQHERNKYDTKIITQLIKEYNKGNQKPKARALQYKLNEIIVFREDEWIKLLKDEIQVSSSEIDKIQLLSKFERALSDGLYINLINLYMDYVEKIYLEGVIKRNKVKLIQEKLISLLCHDFKNGSLAFSFAIKMEQLYQKGELSYKERQDSLSTLRRLYHRQLSLPLMEIDIVYDEYQQWETQEGELVKAKGIYDTTYTRFNSVLDIEDEYVDRIESLEPDQEDFMEIFESFTEKEIDPNALKIYYMKTLVKNQGYGELWLSFITFLEQKFPQPEQLTALKAAVKACPSDQTLCIKYLRILERLDVEVERFRSEFDIIFSQQQELEAKFLINKCYLEYFIRACYRSYQAGNVDPSKKEQILNEFREQHRVAIDAFFNDESIWRFFIYQQAQIETYLLKNKEGMNSLMESYVHRCGSQLTAWEQYIQLEMVFGIQGVKGLVNRGIEYCKDDNIYKIALDFIKYYGNISELESIEEKYQNHFQIESLLEDEGEAMEEEGMQEELAMEEEADQEDAPKPPNKKRKDKSALQNDSTKKKIKTEEQKIVTVYIKNFNLDSNQLIEKLGDIVAQNIRIIKGRKGEQRGIGYLDFDNVETANQAIEILNNQQIQASFSEPPSQKNDQITLFLNNLPFSITKEKLLEKLKDFALYIQEIRIIYDKNNNVKGYGYLEMKDREGYEEVYEYLKDNNDIEGWKIIVQECDSQKKTKKSQNLVAFLRGLSFKVKEQDILEFFGEGKIQKIHLVKSDEGKPKGIAYIQFKDQNFLKEALGLKEGVIKKRTFQILKSDRDITIFNKEEIQQEVKNKDSKNNEDFRKYL